MKLSQTKTHLLALALAAVAFTAQAHPGHHPFDHGFTHAVTSPYHVIVLSAAGAGVFLLSRLVRRQLPRRAMQIAGAAMMLGALALWGLAA